MKKQALAVAVTLLLSLSAWAVDGVTLINQSTVMAAGGFPYKVTQSGSYKLSGNLTVPANVDGINISVDNVTIDLNGFSIVGPITCTGLPTTTSCSGSSGVGIYASNYDNITVLNGSIVGFNQGLNVGGFGELVEKVHAKWNSGFGIAVYRGTVRLSSAELGGGHGISVSFGLAEGNNIIGNAGYGLLAFNSVYGTNSLHFNGADVDNAASVSENNNYCTSGPC